MKLLVKFSLTGIIMCAITIALGITGIVMFNGVSDTIKEVETITMQNVLYGQDMSLSVVQVQQWLTDASATGFTDGFDEAEIWARNFRENSKKLRSNFELHEEADSLKKLDELDHSFENFLTQGREMANIYIKSGQTEGNEKMLEFDAFSMDITERVTVLNTEQLDELHQEFLLIERKEKSFMQVVIAGIVAAALAGLLVIFVIVRQVAQPLVELEKVAETIAKGDLSAKVPPETMKLKDEIGSLANALNAMNENLHEIISSILKNSELSAASAQELSASAEEVNTSMEQVSSTIQEIAKGAQGLSRNSADATEKSKQTDVAAKEGAKSAEFVQMKMSDIDQTTKDGSNRVRALGAKSESIGKIVETINTISEQTNLLALNAAIEAARAGEAGRGFAVVADEVRKLAEESKKATGQIASLISDIQAEINESVASMDKNNTQVEAGAKIVASAVESFNKIPRLIDDVNRALADVSAVSEENAAGAEEVSASVEEVTSSMQQVANSAQKLSAAAEDLKKISGKIQAIVF